ncbi:hypothetical protein KIN20_007005 [Parelaphostrongylus tenuis]|uniref:Uncharacterized protein n=1 Tax=Parelaphostrongylus tenuis TaxID=148309 RepID=A0AAD5MKX7_PARTN|nr:hypothetical protein KIN20_007005 [Parelaphostrongylus tenuis]
MDPCKPGRGAEATKIFFNCRAPLSSTLRSPAAHDKGHLSLVVAAHDYMRDLICHLLTEDIIPRYQHARSAEEEIGDEVDDSMEDNALVADTGSCKAPSPKTLPFDDDKQVLKRPNAHMQGLGQLS